jgi:hypothetical protein
MTVEFQDFISVSGETLTAAIIYNEDGSFTSMPKEVYEAQQAEQSTPSVIDEA